MPMDAKARASASVAEAKAELDRALAEIDAIETYDPSLVGFVAHAITNYNSVTTAIVELLQATLRDHQDTDVAMWLDGLRHAAELAQHSVGRLVSASVPHDFPLKLDYVNLPVMMARACDHFRRRADLVRIHIACEAVGEVPLVWGDRVAVAVVADNLLSLAVQSSEPNGTIRVRVTAQPDHVICSICDAGVEPVPRPEKRVLRWPKPIGPARNEAEIDARLEVAAEFVERMDGTLWTEGQPAGGTCVSFRLPAAG
jgi:signal transduction histidine kinase